MPKQRLAAPQFQKQLLNIMEQKHHWAWSYFSGPTLTKAQLQIHFQQEYAVYVRDFPVLLARIHGKNPPLDVRKMLAENIYEEDTGKLSLGTSHPELFLTMMEGLGYRRREFETIQLLPAARRYREWLDKVTKDQDWVVGAAVLTIFVEGSIHDRHELERPPRSKSLQQIQHKLKTHPLVKYYGVSPRDMDLIRAHQMVEVGHRHDAYAMVVRYALTRSRQHTILSALRKAFQLWLSYRDGVAHACGLKKE